MINKITDKTKELILQKSVRDLPDNPSEQGYTADEIKNAITNPLADSDNSIITEINRIVEEINDENYAKNKTTEADTGKPVIVDEKGEHKAGDSVLLGNVKIYSEVADGETSIVFEFPD